jgi:hypothetical protein
VTLEVLRSKLDAAIVAEAWDAVKVIHDRIVALEREAEGNDGVVTGATSRRRSAR